MSEWFLLRTCQKETCLSYILDIKSRMPNIENMLFDDFSPIRITFSRSLQRVLIVEMLFQNNENSACHFFEDSV